MAPGVNLSCLIDCCHSAGPVCDLPFYYQHQVDDRMQPNQGMNFHRLIKLSRHRKSIRKSSRIEKGLKLKDQFPLLSESCDSALLSRLVYRVKSKASSEFQKGEVSKLKLNCNFFFDDSSGLQTMIVTSAASNFIAVVFRGSDEWQDWNTNRKVLLTGFGPKKLNYSLKFPWHLDRLVKVHRGFNFLVFGEGRTRTNHSILRTGQRLTHSFQNFQIRQLTQSYSIFFIIKYFQ